MEPVYRFLATYEGLIYILLLLGGLFAFRWLWKAWREWRDSVFGLEREFAVRRVSQALMVSILIIILFFGELFLASFIVPAMPASDMATPTLDILNQTQSALSGNPADVLTSTTAAPNTTSDLAIGCVPDEIIITSPEPGQQISGTVKLVGTVNVESFGFYKYEVAPQGTDTWATISADRKLVDNGELGIWDTTALTPGDYQIRLEVTDSQGQTYPACVFPVRVVAP